MAAKRKSVSESGAFLMDQVRTHDRGRYLTALFARNGVRPHLMALLAFDIELSRIHGQVSEPDLAAIRYQWWRDQVNGDVNSADGPVATALLNTITECQLPRGEVLALIDGHEMAFDGELGGDGDEDGDGFSPRDVESAARRTYGCLHVLMARVLGEENSWALDVAREAGAALGMVRFLRGTPEIAKLLEVAGSPKRFQSGLKVRTRLALRKVSEYGAPGKTVLPAFMAATLARREMRHFKHRQGRTLSARAEQADNLRCMVKLSWARFTGHP